MRTKDDCRTILNILRLGTNVIKTECTDCRRHSDKVICLGELQAFLIRMLFADDQQWDIRDGQLHILSRDFLDASLRCPGRPEEMPALWHEVLSEPGADEKTEEKKIKNYIQSQCGIFRHWNKVCEPILLALAVNSCRTVVERNTLIHLCMNGTYGAVLFRKVIMKIMSLLVANWFEPGKLEEIAKYLRMFFRDLLNYEYKPEIDQNIEECRIRMCDRIQGSNIDMLYRAVKHKDACKKWVKGEDLLQYFANLEGKDRSYYASRLSLIQQILIKKEVKEELRLPNELVQFSGKNEMTNYTSKIREVIYTIDVQDKSRQREAVDKLSRMIDLCVMDWIDEEVKEVHDWILAG